MTLNISHPLIDRSGESHPPAAGARGLPRRTVMYVTWSLVAGGSEMYAFTIASNLNSNKYRAAMCAIDQGGALEGEIRRLGIPYTLMNRRPGIELGLMRRLYRLFRQNRVDVIHTHHFNQLFYSVAAAKLLGIRIIHTEHSIEVYKRRRYRIALRFLSLFCDKVTAIGSDGARVLQERVGIPARKLQIIRAGVNVAKFDESRSRAKHLLGLKEQDRVASIVARLFPEKNHRLLLAAFAEVVRKVPNARLLIVGDGTEKDDIRAEIARLGLGEQVQMLGVRRDVATILAASDLFVLSSDREGLPIAVLEAMAAARPVVATAVGDLPSIVRDGETGRLVPSLDPQALAAALADVLSNPDQAAAMGETGRRLVEEHYGVKKMIAEHEALYSSDNR